MKATTSVILSKTTQLVRLGGSTLNIMYRYYRFDTYRIDSKLKKKKFLFIVKMLYGPQKTTYIFQNSNLGGLLGRAHTESTRHESTRSPPPLYPI